MSNGYRISVFRLHTPCLSACCTRHSTSVIVSIWSKWIHIQRATISTLLHIERETIPWDPKPKQQTPGRQSTMWRRTPSQATAIDRSWKRQKTYYRVAEWNYDVATIQGSKQSLARVGLFRIMALLDNFAMVLAFLHLSFAFWSVKQRPLRVKFALLCKFMAALLYPEIDRHSKKWFI